MKSVTKNRLETVDIQKIMNFHFPNESIKEMKEFEEGMFNAAYYIRGNHKLKNGVVLKTGPLSTAKTLTYEKDIIKTEVEVYHLLSKKDILVPKVLVRDFSKKLIPCNYFVMEFVEGTIWNKSDKKRVKESRSGLMKELGACNAEIHSVSGEWFGYIKEDSSFQFDNWYDAFYSMVKNILKDGKKERCKLPYNEIESAIVRNKKQLLEVTESKLVSFDLWAGNVLLKESNGRYHISGLIDFERCFYGDPLADFAASKTSMLYNIDKEPDFVKGYSEATGQELQLGESERIRMNLYSLYLVLIMNVETYRYGKVFAGIMKGYTKSQIKKLLKELNV